MLGQFNALDKQVEIRLSDEVLGGSWDALVAGRCDLTLGAGVSCRAGILSTAPSARLNLYLRWQPITLNPAGDAG